MKKLILPIIFTVVVNSFALENGVARTPPMAWNGFMSYGFENADEKIVKSAANTLASSGLRDAGWKYIEIDAGWKEGDCSRDQKGGWVVSARKFPGGMKALCDYVHSKGLKLGFYTIPSWSDSLGGPVNDCSYKLSPRPNGYYEADADTLVAWGIDYLKIDMALCGEAIRLTKWVVEKSMKAGKPIMIQTHEESERTVVPWNGKQVVMRDISNTFRVTKDNLPSWVSQLETINKVAGNNYNAQYAGPGAWCEGGGMGCFTFNYESNTKLTAVQNRSNFSLVSIATYPLEITMDTTAMKAPEVATMLTNAEVIAINQDSLGLQGRVIKRSDNTQIWWKPLKDGSRAVGLFNSNANAVSSIYVTWSEILLNSGNAQVRDLWQHKDLGSFKDTFKITNVPGHTCEVYKITGSPKSWESSWNLYTDRPNAKESFQKYWDPAWGPFTWNAPTSSSVNKQNFKRSQSHKFASNLDFSNGASILSLDGKTIRNTSVKDLSHLQKIKGTSGRGIAIISNKSGVSLILK